MRIVLQVKDYMFLQKTFVTLLLATILHSVSHFSLAYKGDNKATLKVDLSAVNKWRDTLYYYKSKLRTCRYAKIQVSLNNNTSDTLRYVNMSCSSLDIFTTNTNDVRIFQDNYCFKNGPAVFKIPPYGSVSLTVPVYLFTIGNSVSKFASEAFKIGMGFFEYTGKASLMDDIAERMSVEKSKIIWSDTITAR